MDIRRNYNGTIISLNLIHFVEYACVVRFSNIEHYMQLHSSLDFVLMLKFYKREDVARIESGHGPHCACCMDTAGSDPQHDRPGTKPCWTSFSRWLL